MHNPIQHELNSIWSAIRSLRRKVASMPTVATSNTDDYIFDVGDISFVDDDEVTITAEQDGSNVVMHFALPKPAEVDVNSTTTVASGNAAQVKNVGTSRAALLDFEIPEGKTTNNLQEFSLNAYSNNAGKIAASQDGTNIKFDTTAYCNGFEMQDDGSIKILTSGTYLFAYKLRFKEQTTVYSAICTGTYKQPPSIDASDKLSNVRYGQCILKIGAGTTFAVKLFGNETVKLEPIVGSSITIVRLA